MYSEFAERSYEI